MPNLKVWINLSERTVQKSVGKLLSVKITDKAILGVGYVHVNNIHCMCVYMNVYVYMCGAKQYFVLVLWCK